MVHHSTDPLMYLTLSQIITEPPFFPLHTPKQGPQLSVTVETYWIKVTRYNFYTSWECTKNTNI